MLAPPLKLLRGAGPPRPPPPLPTPMAIGLFMKYCPFYIFAVFSYDRGSHFGWSICEKSDINFKQVQDHSD